MGIWNWLFGGDIAHSHTDINPTTGLPMLGDVGGVDVGGNPFGMDLHQIDSHSSHGFDGGIDMGTISGGDWTD